MIKINSTQLNAVVVFPKTLFDRAHYCLSLFLVFVPVIYPGSEIAGILDGTRTVEHHIGITILTITSFFQGAHSIAQYYTNVKPQQEDFFRVLGDQPAVYPTGIYGKMMLRFNSFSMFCSYGLLMWLVYAVWVGRVQAGFSLALLMWALSYLFSALIELGWLGKYPPHLT